MKSFVINERGQFEAEDVKVMWKNFSGAPDDFNPAGGKRSFTLVLESSKEGEAEIAQQLIDHGYNVKKRIGTDEDGNPSPWWTLNIGVGWNKETGNGPTVILCRPGERPVKLNDLTVGMLDKCKIGSIDISVYKYEWHRGADSGFKACCGGFKCEEIFDSKIDKYFAEACMQYDAEHNDSPFE